MSLSQIFRDFDDGREDEPTESVPRRDLKEGQVIEQYTLTKPLGEGGFGSVWLATQERPFRRRVALKILKMGMDTEEILGRFDQERQAMAMMDHPNIAMVFDAGSTPSGRPFVAMELIQAGVPITEYCRRENLSIEEKIHFFTPACEAIQHAHQKGIIHRDIKPTNILISGDGSAKVKVIDFGIAKAIGDEELSEIPIKTRIDRLIGTPAYMSPEQLSGSGNTDTRSDVYSLGVVLYELLTGELPFSNSEFDREVPPPKPSTQLAASSENQRTLSPSQLKGDLDCIILKALDPVPERRYDSPVQLANDLKRHLANEVIIARPESSLYVARRFARRNKAAVFGIIGVFVALAIGFTVSTLAFIREKEARSSEAIETAKSLQVTEFLTEILSSAGVSKALGRDATMLREILDEASSKIEETADINPEVEQKIRKIIGNSFMDLDEYPKASAQYRRALEIARGLDSVRPGELATALFNLARSTELSGDVKQSEALLREAMALLESHEGGHANQLLEMKTLLAWIYLKSGRSAMGEAPAREAYEAWVKDPEKASLRDAPVTYATILAHLGKKEKSEDIHRHELEWLRSTLGPRHPDIVSSLGNLGRVLLGNRKVEEAEQILTEASEMGRVLFQGRNPHEDQVLTNLAKIHGINGDVEQERVYAKEAIFASQRVYEEGHRYRKQTARFFEKMLAKQAESAMKQQDSAWLKRCLEDLREMLERSPELVIQADTIKEWEAALAAIDAKR